MKNEQKLRRTYKELIKGVGDAFDMCDNAKTEEEYLNIVEKMCYDVDAKVYVRIHKILTNMEAEGMTAKQLERTVGDVIVSVALDKESRKTIKKKFNKDEA